MIHKLKIETDFIKNLLSGCKKSEIRYDDRNYQSGDILMFSHNDVPLYFHVTHIHKGLGLQDGYVVLSVEKCITPFIK